jgi:hypothetical protein
LDVCFLGDCLVVKLEEVGNDIMVFREELILVLWSRKYALEIRVAFDEGTRPPVKPQRLCISLCYW